MNKSTEPFVELQVLLHLLCYRGGLFVCFGVVRVCLCGIRKAANLDLFCIRNYTLALKNSPWMSELQRNYDLQSNISNVSMFIFIHNPYCILDFEFENCSEIVQIAREGDSWDV